MLLPVCITIDALLISAHVLGTYYRLKPHLESSAFSFQTSAAIELG